MASLIFVPGPAVSRLLTSLAVAALFAYAFYAAMCVLIGRADHSRAFRAGAIVGYAGFLAVIAHAAWTLDVSARHLGRDASTAAVAVFSVPIIAFVVATGLCLTGWAVGLRMSRS